MSSCFKFHLKEEIALVHGMVEVDLSLESGKLTALQGDNGVGKTLMINHLKKEVLGELGQYAHQFPLTPMPHLSAVDYFNFLKSWPREKNQHWESFKTTLLGEKKADFFHLPIVQLSGGQNQVVKILGALMMEAKVYVLDEPDQYLDQVTRENLRSLLKQLKSLNYSLLVVSHRSSFLQELVDSYAYVRGSRG